MDPSRMNMNFGPPVAFTGASDPTSSLVQEQTTAIAQLESALYNARHELANARGEGTVLAAAKAKADQAASIAKNLFLKHHRMEDYDHIGKLQGEVAALKQTNRDHREKLTAFSDRCENLLAEVADKDGQIATLSSEKANLKAAVADVKQKLEDQVAATKDIDAHLENAYADIKLEESAHESADKARDDAEAKLKETELELRDLHTQWESSQKTISDLESQAEGFQDLEREHAAMQDELDEQRKRTGNHDRTILVKDARILHLETQYQKALEGKLNAEAAASAAATPTAEPTAIFTGGEDSLEAELAATSDSDYGDEASEYEQLDYSDITEIAETTPGEALTQTLALSVVQATDIAPIAPPQTSTSTTQTDVSEKTEIAVQTVEPRRYVIATQTDTPKVTYDIVQSATIDISPVEPTKAPSTTEAQTEATDPVNSTATQTSLSFEETLDQLVTTIAAPPEKKSKFTNLHWLALLSTLLCFYFWAQLKAYENHNGYSHYARHAYSNGAFGYGRYLFGIWPVGFDIGHDWLSEEICKQTSRAIMNFEAWAGVTPTPLY